MNRRRLWAIMVKEIRQLRRDRVTAAMIVGIPSLQLLLFGFAINLDVRGIDAGIVDQANSSTSRALVQDLMASGVIVERERVATPAQLQDHIRSGRISVGVIVPADFERRLAEHREAAQVLVDGSDTSVQNAVRQLAQMPVGDARSSQPS
ncbi:MAG: ABC transporter, partial [Lysobacterales bacterium CG_4_9_14_3_um_filter_62_6]